MRAPREVTVNCDVLDIADRDQRLIVYTAVPGSPSAEALRLLSVIGTQRMDVAGWPGCRDGTTSAHATTVLHFWAGERIWRRLSRMRSVRVG
jgi:hypothetical protein